MQNKNKLEQIVEYIKKYKVEWQLSGIHIKWIHMQMLFIFFVEDVAIL